MTAKSPVDDAQTEMVELTDEAAGTPDDDASTETIELTDMAAKSPDDDASTETIELTDMTAGTPDSDAPTETIELIDEAAGTPDHDATTETIELTDMTAGTPEDDAPTEILGLTDESAGTLDDDAPVEMVELTDDFIAGSDQDNDDVETATTDEEHAARPDVLLDEEEIIAMEGPTEEFDQIALDVEATLESKRSDELPDLTGEIHLEFENEDEDFNLATGDEAAAENGDDIIARTIQNTLSPGEVTEQIDLAMIPEFEFNENNEALTEEAERISEENLAAATIDEIRILAEEDSPTDIDDEPDMAFTDDSEDSADVDVETISFVDEALPFEELDDSAVEDADDIVEITEFDQHFSEEKDLELEQSEVLGAVDTNEDDYLELIEIEDDDPAAERTVAELGGQEELDDEKQIDNFFSDAMANEPVLQSEDFESVEETPALNTDIAMAAAMEDEEVPATANDAGILDSEAEIRLEYESAEDEYDFFALDDDSDISELETGENYFESREISDQVDRLDTFSSEDSAAALADEPYSEDPFADTGSMQERQPAIAGPAGSPPATPDQIDSILERVIREKFGGKIEGIIYEAIEKAVSKEIERLKGALLDNVGPVDDE